MINAVTRTKEEEKPSTDSGISINVTKLVGNKKEEDLYNPKADVEDNDSTSRRGRPRKTEPVNMTKKKSSGDFADRYTKTNALLDQTIFEIDDLNASVKKELKTVTQSKTLKKKYEYMSDLATTSGSLLNTKVTAIRELNKSISDSINLEIKMLKENKEAEETDDKRIMDMYNAFINTPIGAYAPPTAPSAVDMVMSNSGTTITPTVNGEFQTDDLGYNQYMNNLSPEQRKIQLEGQNIKLCVVFDPDTGNRYFDNINMDTNESVPGLPLPEAHFLDDLNINMNTGVARNTNLNLTYPVVLKRTGADFTGF